MHGGDGRGGRRHGDSCQVSSGPSTSRCSPGCAAGRATRIGRCTYLWLRKLTIRPRGHRAAPPVRSGTAASGPVRHGGYRSGTAASGPGFSWPACLARPGPLARPGQPPGRGASQGPASRRCGGAPHRPPEEAGARSGSSGGNSCRPCSGAAGAWTSARERSRPRPSRAGCPIWPALVTSRKTGVIWC